MSLQQKIPFWTAVLMSINIIVGGGIFAGPQSMAALAGSLSFASWLLAAVLMFPIVWAVARAPVLFPGEGGFYHYCAQGISPVFGFVAQWMFLLGYMMGTASAMTVLLQTGLAQQLGFSFASEHPSMTHAMILTLFSLLNLMPLGLVSRIQAGATLLKLIPLLIVVALTAFFYKSDLSYPLSLTASLPATIPTVIFGYLGFEACCSLTHLLKDGPESVGKVVLTAFFITALLYTVFNFGLLQIMGVDSLAAEGAMAFPSYLGGSQELTFALGVGISSAILLSFSNSLFGVSLGNITNIARISGMSQPMAMLLHGFIVWCLLCFTSELRTIFAFTVLGVGSAYTLTVVAVWRENWKLKHHFQVALMTLGFGSCAILFACCWLDLGTSHGERFLAIAPMFTGLAIGGILYRAKILTLR
ncbi:MAG: APC family permease [Myxococcaceae bacterium]|nr:APC family permease [Myxococcaceae bacterium]MBH2005916.1 APC family permease [Myxococcaceae bacterium]